jgi:hypothetical protein
MKYDYSFFENHMRKQWTFSGWNIAANFEGDLITFFDDVSAAQQLYEVVERSPDIINSDALDIVRIQGAYSKGGAGVQPLEESLKTKLPEDFAQFYEQFGECLIFTRGLPVNILPLERIIEDFEDDRDDDSDEGRFFRFAEYDGYNFYIALRRHDQTDEWQIVACDYGLLYSDMIGPRGNEHVVDTSFYSWIKGLIETNGYHYSSSPRDEDMPYLTVLED